MRACLSIVNRDTPNLLCRPTVLSPSALGVWGVRVPNLAS